MMMMIARMLMKPLINRDNARKVKIWKGICLKMTPATKQKAADKLQTTTLPYWMNLLLLLPVMMVRLAAGSCSTRSTAVTGRIIMNNLGQQFSWLAGHWFGILR